MSITIKDIAKIANVSITTVSLILNNKCHNIGEETIKRVRSIIEEHNYRPNALARGLITSKTRTIGLLVPNITNQFFAEITKGVEDGLSEHGYNVFLCNSYNDIDKEKQYIRVLKEQRVEGVILSSTNTVTQDYYSYLKEQGVAFVLLDRHASEPLNNGIIVDDRKGGFLAAQHLLELGHRKIGCLVESTGLCNIDERLHGYKDALAQYGVPYEEKFVVSGELTIEGGCQAAIKLIEEQIVTAIFATNDLMAIGVYEAAIQLGKRIPEDISVVGFDDISFAHYLTPKLTTVRQPIYEIGRRAAANLIYILQNKLYMPSTEVLDVELIIRNSTSSPR
ncbi:LacI family transcriptional regulator [Paenibacillus sp. N1-5-1-14]|uniref:LacI family DNA-binding transcriptional regulator n=1 Tax=Paenibacillus radicibacter TaxID=2972488 RepID=UPI002158DDD6|nr:LacI family DNA-binding transcriptional regulator [Paenibacillus radicibacter]MCR8642717.1 LacI family transcriptional regulator [Paenibacillus radicibacter]